MKHKPYITRDLVSETQQRMRSHRPGFNTSNSVDMAGAANSMRTKKSENRIESHSTIMTGNDQSATIGSRIGQSLRTFVSWFLPQTSRKNVTVKSDKEAVLPITQPNEIFKKFAVSSTIIAEQDYALKPCVEQAVAKTRKRGKISFNDFIQQEIKRKARSEITRKNQRYLLKRQHQKGEKPLEEPVLQKKQKLNTRTVELQFLLKHRNQKNSKILSQIKEKDHVDFGAIDVRPLPSDGRRRTSESSISEDFRESAIQRVSKENSSFIDDCLLVDMQQNRSRKSLNNSLQKPQQAKKSKQKSTTKAPIIPSAKVTPQEKVKSQVTAETAKPEEAKKVEPIKQEQKKQEETPIPHNKAEPTLLNTESRPGLESQIPIQIQGERTSIPPVLPEKKTPIFAQLNQSSDAKPLLFSFLSKNVATPQTQQSSLFQMFPKTTNSNSIETTMSSETSTQPPNPKIIPEPTIRHSYFSALTGPNKEIQTTNQQPSLIANIFQTPLPAPREEQKVGMNSLFQKETHTNPAQTQPVDSTLNKPVETPVPQVSHPEENKVKQPEGTSHPQSQPVKVGSIFSSLLTSIPNISQTTQSGIIAVPPNNTGLPPIKAEVAPQCDPQIVKPLPAPEINTSIYPSTQPQPQALSQPQPQPQPSLQPQQQTQYDTPSKAQRVNPFLEQSPSIREDKLKDFFSTGPKMSPNHKNLFHQEANPNPVFPINQAQNPFFFAPQQPSIPLSFSQLPAPPIQIPQTNFLQPSTLFSSTLFAPNVNPQWSGQSSNNLFNQSAAINTSFSNHSQHDQSMDVDQPAIPGFLNHNSNFPAQPSLFGPQKQQSFLSEGSGDLFKPPQIPLSHHQSLFDASPVVQNPRQMSSNDYSKKNKKQRI